MASSIDVITRAREHAAKSGFDWEKMEPEQMDKFIQRAVRDFQGPSVVFPPWVAGPTPCLTMTNSIVYPRGRGILADPHGAERYEVQHPAYTPYVRRSQQSGLMYSSKYPPIGIDHADDCKCDDCKWGY